MWSIRKRVVSTMCTRTFGAGVPRRNFSDKVSLNIHHTIAGRRRFYETVGVEEIGDTGTVSRHTAEDLHFNSKSRPYFLLHFTQFKVTLDGRTLKTPGMNPLHVSQ
jgi:hypothetical protein